MMHGKHKPPKKMQKMMDPNGMTSKPPKKKKK